MMQKSVSYIETTIAEPLSPGTGVPGAALGKPRTAKKSYSIHVLDRMMAILDRFAAGSPELRLTDLSGLGLHKSSLYRLLEAMRSHRLVDIDPVTKRYRLGLRLFELGTLAVSRLEIGRCAQSSLEALVEATGETAHLGILDHGEVVYIARAESRHALRMPSAVGRRGPAYCTGIGKSLLASLSEEDLQAYVEATELQPRTRRTLVDAGELLKDLRLVRSRGYSVDDEEIYPGIRCVAAPVRDHTGEVVAAISVAGPSTRIPKEQLPQLAGHVVSAADRVSARLGACHTPAPRPRRRQASGRPRATPR